MHSFPGYADLQKLRLEIIISYLQFYYGHLPTVFLLVLVDNFFLWR